LHADQLILYAPNVHTGGGLVLLQALLSAWPGERPLFAFLDKRACGKLTLPKRSEVTWVAPTLRARLLAEFQLRRICRANDTVFCLHNLPPAVPVRGKIVVFHQNRILLGLDSLRQFPMRVALRVSAERLLARMFRHRVSHYIVQTATMARNLSRWYSGSSASDAPIRVLPFVAEHVTTTVASASKTWDFLYVADGVAHKNHARLLDAWRNLAAQGIRPTLALTLGSGDTDTLASVRAFEAEGHSNVVNLGKLPHDQLLSSYQHARALIFPSLSESFGLPLIEAKRYGVPILASELDFVRDVCQPVQTFDPYSDRSIARAVRRFLGHPDDMIDLRNAAEFWSEFFSGQEIGQFKE
jgi:glycosyltransferase involved in cell wall biosynthesis